MFKLILTPVDEFAADALPARPDIESAIGPRVS
jgi:hypothetical protein